MSANKDDLKARLSDEQYSVTQNGGTERPFTGHYVDNKDDILPLPCPALPLRLTPTVHYRRSTLSQRSPP